MNDRSGLVCLPRRQCCGGAEHTKGAPIHCLDLNHLPPAVTEIVTLEQALQQLQRLAGVASIVPLNGSEPGLRVTYTNGVIITVLRTLVDRRRFDMWYPGDEKDRGPKFVHGLPIDEVLERLNSMAHDSVT